MKTTFTQTTDFFESINAPQLRNVNYINNSQLFPKYLLFNQTYYKYKNGKLVAFRILAYAFMCKDYNASIYGLTYLVQLPNEEPKWIYNFIDHRTNLFNKPSDFIEHQKGTFDCTMDLHWDRANCVFPDLAYAAVISPRGNVWKWSSEYNCPKNDFHPTFNYFVVCEKGLFIGINEGDAFGKYYLSSEECVKATLDGMEIVDFAEPPIKITINVLSNTPKIHTLRFIEE